MNHIKYCRHSPQKIKRLDNINYFGADQPGALEFNGDVMINFTRVSDIPSSAKIPQLSEHMDIPFEEIMVLWPDFGVPKVKLSFWEALHSYILEKGWDDACFHCQAGHGRTGTALAAMLIAIEGYSAQQAVWEVRASYCAEAVETSEQCLYLQKVDQFYNDREIKEDECPIPAMWFHMREAQEKEDKEKDKISVV